ncbi:hypothetical protein CYMTET_30684, partial [Cymbomonas tetramitiformis]
MAELAGCACPDDAAQVNGPRAWRSSLDAPARMTQLGGAAQFCLEGAKDLLNLTFDDDGETGAPGRTLLAAFTTLIVILKGNEVAATERGSAALKALEKRAVIPKHPGSQKVMWDALLPMLILPDAKGSPSLESTFQRMEALQNDVGHHRLPLDLTEQFHIAQKLLQHDRNLGDLDPDWELTPYRRMFMWCSSILKMQTEQTIFRAAYDAHIASSKAESIVQLREELEADEADADREDQALRILAVHKPWIDTSLSHAAPEATSNGTNLAVTSNLSYTSILRTWHVDAPVRTKRILEHDQNYYNLKRPKIRHNDEHAHIDVLMSEADQHSSLHSKVSMQENDQDARDRDLLAREFK